MIQYKINIKDSEKTPEAKRKAMEEVENADDEFIERVKKHKSDDYLMSNVAINAIRAKTLLEKKNMLDPAKFSLGSGKNDPAHRLRLLSRKYNKVYDKKVQHGGFSPVLIPILASVASTLIGRIYDTIKGKFEGKGYKIPNHVTARSKRKFLIDIVKFIL